MRILWNRAVSARCSESYRYQWHHELRWPGQSRMLSPVNPL